MDLKLEPLNKFHMGELYPSYRYLGLPILLDRFK